MNVNLIKSIDRAILVLKSFNEERNEMKLSELSELLSINKSTLHGIIATLRYHGLMDQDPDTQKYRLGLGLLHLGAIVKDSLSITKFVKPYMEELVEVLEETVHFGALDGLDVVYLDKVEAQQSVRIVTNVGARNPSYCTGIGKVLLADMDFDFLEEHLTEAFEAKTPYTITNKDDLFQELTQINRNGYAMDNQEITLGLTCVAAPIYDGSGKAVYAMSVSGATARMNESQITKSIFALKKVTQEISKSLGYQSNELVY